MEKFRELGLKEELLEAIEELGFIFPTPVQEKVIPVILGEENDLVALAQTGTGKTAIAHYIINKNLKEGKKTFYTAPLKALSNDKLREFENIYGKTRLANHSMPRLW